MISKPLKNTYCYRIEQLESRRQLSASMWIDANTDPQSPAGAIAGTPTVVGSQAFFTLDDGVHGNELWRTDGTEAGTRMVKDINPGPAGSTPSYQRMRAHAGKLFFVADDGTHGEELWVSDGSAAGTYMVSDLNPGVAGSTEMNLTSFGSSLYFMGDEGTHIGFSMFKADATSITRLYAFGSNGLISSNTPFVVQGNKMFMNPRSGTIGAELWVTDGTTAGTQLIKEVNPGSGAGVLSLWSANGLIYFQGQTSTQGIELWRSDGTAAGTFGLGDLNAGTAGSSPEGVTALAGKTYFLATDVAHGKALWVTDGTVAGTKLAVDLKTTLALRAPQISCSPARASRSPATPA